MKLSAIFFSLLLIVMFCCVAPPPLAAQDLAARGVAGHELAGKTFLVDEQAGPAALARQYHAYFKKDGILVMKFSGRTWRAGKWLLDEQGNLCISTVSRAENKTSLHVTKRGRLVKDSATDYRWYDGRARLRADLRLRGEGNRLPQSTD